MWLFERYIFRSPNRTSQKIIIAGVAILLSISISTLTTLLLGIAERYTPIWELSILALISMAGLFIGHRLKHAHASDTFKSGFFMVGPIWLIIFLGLMIPNRGEWILGGWDSGIYVNEGIALERTGGVQPDDTFFYTDLTSKEQAVFIRSLQGREERFPGVVTDSEKQTFQFEFFRLTPSLLAIFYRSGGMHGIVHTHTIIGLLMIICFLALLLNVTDYRHALCSALFLIAQPIWLYHTYTPLSEPLELLFIIGIGIVLPWRDEKSLPTLFLGLVVFLLILNRFSFLPFAGILVCIVTWLDIERNNRAQAVQEHLALWIFIISAALIGIWIAPTSLKTWDVLPIMLAITGLCLGLSIAIDTVAFRPTYRERFCHWPSWINPLFVIMTFLLLIALWFRKKYFPGNEHAENLYKLIFYTGPLLFLTACMGGWLLFCTNKQRLSKSIRFFILFLTGITLLLLIHKNIHDWYPWATRRYLSFTVPLLAILAGYPLFLVWKMFPKKGGIIALSLLTIILLPTLQKGYHAWNHTEYNGITTLIKQIAHQIDEDDIIVTDHPWWGTPLAIIYGKKVLDGKRLWIDKTKENMKIGLKLFERLNLSKWVIR